MHDKFKKPGDGYDIAVIKLEDKIPMDNLKIMKLAGPNDKTPRKFHIAGWGKTEKAESSSHNNYAMVELQDCPKDVSANNICALGTDEKVGDTCEGDSGGPLWDASEFKQFGVTSSDSDPKDGIQCGQKKKPGLYTDVRKFSKWIKKHIKEPLTDRGEFNQYMPDCVKESSSCGKGPNEVKVEPDSRWDWEECDRKCLKEKQLYFRYNKKDYTCYCYAWKKDCKDEETSGEVGEWLMGEVNCADRGWGGKVHWGCRQKGLCKEANVGNNLVVKNTTNWEHCARACLIREKMEFFSYLTYFKDRKGIEGPLCRCTKTCADNPKHTSWDNEKDWYYGSKLCLGSKLNNIKCKDDNN